VEETLAKAGIFQGVDPDAALSLGSHMETVEYQRGSSIFSEGELGDRLYVILAGKIKLGRHSPDGRENLLAVMGPSDMFGELTVFDEFGRSSCW